jgi:hypothetical protein
MVNRVDPPVAKYTVIRGRRNIFKPSWPRIRLKLGV